MRIFAKILFKNPLRLNEYGYLRRENGYFMSFQVPPLISFNVFRNDSQSKCLFLDEIPRRN